MGEFLATKILSQDAQLSFIGSYIEGIVRGYRNSLLTGQNNGN
jgi:hypothetical protein